MTRLLEQEQADIDEIENSDQDYLNELKASIAEQRCVRPRVTKGMLKMLRYTPQQRD